MLNVRKKCKCRGKSDVLIMRQGCLDRYFNCCMKRLPQKTNIVRMEPRKRLVGYESYWMFCPFTQITPNPVQLKI